MMKPVLALVALLAVALLAFWPHGTAHLEESAIDLSKYRVVFSEDFDTLDASANGPGTRWTTHTPWNGDFGDAKFTNPGPAGPFKAEGGTLTIEARKNPDGQWQSGLLSSMDRDGNGFGQQYGYFEIRAKLPPGKGLWPAFWLNAFHAKGSTEPGLEIDVVEHYGHFPAAYQALVHIWPKPANDDETGRKTVITVPSGSLYADFHTYGVDVSPQWITIYLDRIAKWRCPTPPQHRSKMMLLVNLAMGSGWPIDETPNPSDMLVDYIRVWEPVP